MISFSMFFFFNDTATTEIYTLSLHDALPIWPGQRLPDLALMGQPGLAQLLPPGPGGPGSDGPRRRGPCHRTGAGHPRPPRDRKSTRLNSSHANISYAVFCLKKKNKQVTQSIV